MLNISGKAIMGTLTTLINLFPEDLKRNAIVDLFQEPAEDHWTLDLLGREELCTLLVNVIISYKDQCPNIAREVDAIDSDCTKPKVKEEEEEEDLPDLDLDITPLSPSVHDFETEKEVANNSDCQPGDVGSDDVDNDIEGDPDNEGYGKKKKVERFCAICRKEVHALPLTYTHMKRTHCVSSYPDNDELFMVQAVLVEKDPPYIKYHYKLLDIEVYLQKVDKGKAPILHCGRDFQGTGLCAVPCKTLEDLNKHYAERHTIMKFARVCLIHQCPKCQRSDFKTDSDLTDHYRQEHQAKKPFKCRFCDMTFKLNSHRTNHMTRKHIDPLKHECNQCSETFRFLRELQVHIYKVHEGNETFPCNHCLDEFKTKGDMKRHTLIVHKLDIKRQKKNRECPVCHKVFPRNCTLKRHMLQVHGQSEVPDDVDSYVVIQTVDRRMKCDYCDRVLSSPTIHRQHVFKVHGISTTLKNGKALTCLRCKAQYPTKIEMDAHIQRDHKAEVAKSEKRCFNKNY